MIEILEQTIQSELEFIADLQSKTWESESYSPKRNEREKKERLWYIEKSKESIKFCQNKIEQLLKDAENV